MRAKPVVSFLRTLSLYSIPYLPRACWRWEPNFTDQSIDFLYIPVTEPERLTHWCRNKMDAISQTTFSSAFFLNESGRIPNKISLKFVPNAPLSNTPILVQIMAWRRPGDKPLSEPIVISLPTHICVTRPQWVKIILTFTGCDAILIRK